MRAKPNFRLGKAYWQDPCFLPADLTKELRSILSDKAKMEPEAVDTFMTCCNDDAQWITQILVSAPQADTKARMGKIAAQADKLLEAMHSLSPESIEEFGKQFDTLALVRGLPVRLSATTVRSPRAYIGGEFLGTTWDLLTDMVAVAKYVGDKLQPTSSDQVASLNADRLIRKVSKSYEFVAGKLPPYSKDTWFPLFMDRLAKWQGLRLSCGRARIEKVICAMRNEKAGHPA